MTPAGAACPTISAIRAGAGLLAAILLLMACGGGSTANHPSPTAGALLVFTTWTKDATVTNGPEPGYRPALTSLTSDDVSSAVAMIDASGSTWLVGVSFTPAGRQQFARLTTDNVAACPGDPATVAAANCPGRHLAMWLDLTQSDIDHWGDSAYVAKVTQVFDLRCLMGGESFVECGKFVSDPITLEPITGGSAQIAGNFTQQTAKDFAAAISRRALA